MKIERNDKGLYLVKYNNYRVFSQFFESKDEAISFIDNQKDSTIYKLLKSDLNKINSDINIRYIPIATGNNNCEKINTYFLMKIKSFL